MTERPRLTAVQWAVCVVAAIGFAFDTYELLMLPLVARPAFLELSQLTQGTPEYNQQFAIWFGRLMYWPAVCGGIFGLLGGYLTDLLGRRRVLTWSILLYAGSAFAAGFSTSLPMFLFLRCLTFVGVCVEFVAAVAWLAELFPNPEQRERVLGYTQAFSSIGGFMVAVAFGVAVDLSRQNRLPAIHLPGFLSFLGEIRDPHAAWRYALMSGLLPAFPLIVIRPFLPESPIWREKRAQGTLRRPSLRELFTPRHVRTTVVTTLMFACSFGAAFGAIQLMPQIAPGLEDVQAKVARAIESEKERAKVSGEQLAPAVLARATKDVENKQASTYTKVQEIGGLTGRFLLAILAVRILSRQWLLRCFQLPGLILIPLIFWQATRSNPVLFVIDWPMHWNWYAIHFGRWEVTLFHVGIFLAGLFTVAQFSFWGNYLPRVYPVHLRGTGEGFAANIGGRMLGTSFALVTSRLAAQPFMPGGSPAEKTAVAAAGVALFVYLAGSILCFWLPEPDVELTEE